MHAWINCTLVAKLVFHFLFHGIQVIMVATAMSTLDRFLGFRLDNTGVVFVF